MTKIFISISNKFPVVLNEKQFGVVYKDFLSTLYKKSDDELKKDIENLLHLSNYFTSGSLHDKSVFILKSKQLWSEIYRRNIQPLLTKFTLLYGKDFKLFKDKVQLEDFITEENNAMAFYPNRAQDNKAYADKMSLAIKEITKSLNTKAPEHEKPLVRAMLEAMKLKYAIAVTEDEDEYNRLYDRLEEAQQVVNVEKTKLEKLLGRKITTM
jgi:hypothetical protein